MAAFPETDDAVRWLYGTSTTRTSVLAVTADDFGVAYKTPKRLVSAFPLVRHDAHISRSLQVFEAPNLGLNWFAGPKKSLPSSTDCQSF